MSLDGYISLDGVTIEGRTVKISKPGGSFAVRRIPDYIKGNSVVILNEDIFIDGYQLFMDKGWKRTLRALWHRWF